MKQATAIASVSNIAALNHNSKEKGMNYDELANEANSQTISPVDYLETHAACHLLLSFPRSFFLVKCLKTILPMPLLLIHQTSPNHEQRKVLYVFH